MTVIIQQRQTVSDIAIQVYGSVEAAIEIAEANNISVTDDLQPGISIECPDKVYDRYLQSYMSARRVNPATAADPEGEVRMKIFTEQFTKEFE